MNNVRLFNTQKNKIYKIVLLFDLSVDIKPDDYKNYWEDPDWKTEKDVKSVLTKLGHTVIPFGIYNDIDAFLKLIKDEKPDLVFNMSEAFNGDRNLEPHMTALMELMNIKFTGSGPKSLQLCKDKGLTKIILAHHNIQTPQFIISNKNKPLSSLKDFPYPAFVKPMHLESSEGITKGSYVENEVATIERVHYLHEKYGTDVIIEEFIDGREVYVSLLGNDKISVFPARELVFKDVPESEPKFATYKVKWDAEYRKKWKIESAWVNDLSDPMQKKLNDVCKKIYKLLNIQGFARIDLRIKNEDIYFIEANPNPSISKKEDYALSAHKAGLPYEDLISKIVNLSLSA